MEDQSAIEYVTLNEIRAFLALAKQQGDEHHKYWCEEKKAVTITYYVAWYGGLHTDPLYKYLSEHYEIIEEKRFKLSTRILYRKVDTVHNDSRLIDPGLMLHLSLK